MRKTYHFALLIAMLFIVLHNVIPHSHDFGDEQETMKISVPSSGAIVHGLFIDLGGDHLEAFSHYQASYKDEMAILHGPSITPLISWLVCTPVDDSATSFPIYCSGYQEDIHLGVSVSRGPPMIS